jgi:nitrite reductase/ring-hydroxylating ferredoxin subunit
MGAGPAAGRRKARALTPVTTTTDSYLCRADDIAEGEARGFAHAGGMKCFLVRRGGELFGYWDACPHYGGTPMAWRTNAYLNAAGDRIVCASHGAEFEIDTGRCVLGAALGQCLTRAPIQRTAAGEIHLILREE